MKNRYLAYFILALFIALFNLLFLSPLKAATLEQMAGQMILLGFKGDEVSDKSVQQIGSLIGEGKIGGVFYLKNNVKSLKDVKAINEYLLNSTSFLPPLIAVDQEGGSIERLTRSVGFKEIQSAREIARGQTVESAKRIYANLARNLAALKFNLNFAPVVDLDINKDNPIIARYGRSFGRDSKQVSKYAKAFIEGHRSANILTSLKHFPGHGSTNKDTHIGFVDISNSWQIEELEPYIILLRGGMVDMIMVGHLFHQKFSPKNEKPLPASLSPNWIMGVLRKKLGYRGVVISDDLEMAAVRDNFTLQETVIRAINAGVDILLFSNTANYRISLANEVQNIIIEEAKRNPAFRARIETSFNRIRALKMSIRR